MASSSKRFIKDLVKKLTKQGWKIRQGRRMHYVAHPPRKDMQICSFSSSPSDNRAVQNIIHDFRRRGVDI